MSPLLVLQVRAEARAMLWAAGEFDESDDVFAPLFAYADEPDRDGVSITDEIGAEAVIAIIRKAFGIAAAEA